MVDRLGTSDGKSGPGSIKGIHMLLPHLLLAAILVLSVYSQLAMRSRALVHSSGANSSADYLQYLIGMATDWRVLSAAGATFLAGVCWLLALQRLELGYAFPFMALSFVLVPISARLFLGESLPAIQLLGLGLVVAGVSISALAR
jgi:drug/metabolite transporter (DMT)-like permease